MVAVEEYEFAVDLRDRNGFVLGVAEVESLQDGEQFLVAKVELAGLEVVEGKSERLLHRS